MIKYKIILLILAGIIKYLNNIYNIPSSLWA